MGGTIECRAHAYVLGRLVDQDDGVCTGQDHSVEVGLHSGRLCTTGAVGRYMCALMEGALLAHAPPS
jgi:hypothetical protein